MSRRPEYSFQESLAQELESLAGILNRSGICADTSPLYRAAGVCKGSFGDSWGYDLERLVFKPDYVGRTIPSSVSDVSVVLSVSVTGTIMEEVEVRDPFDTLEFNIFIDGKREDEKGGKVYCFWHLDRDEPEGEDGAQEFIHPSYHFQHGGKHARDTVIDYGASLILESPRLAHPPMEAILGVDFILTNYFRSLYLEFRQEADYVKLIKSAQVRIWKPYAQAIGNHWEPLIDNKVWSSFRLWPQLAP